MPFASLTWTLEKAAAAPPEAGLATLKSRLQLGAAALRAGDALRNLKSAKPTSALRRLLDDRPEVIGTFIWPVQNAAWDARTRWDKIIAHCSIVDALGAPFDFPAHAKLEVLDLSARFDGLKLVLDQPFWFLREGLLVLNLFIGDFRAFSLAFNFCTDEEGARCAYIGAVQGRNRDDILSTYRDLTKALFGIRPRDFLIEAFRPLCEAAGVKRIFAVADQYRHHRHAYFRSKTSFPTNYDEIWQDRDGVRLDEQTFEIPVRPPRRTLEDVKPNKRSMYRKRYDFLDALAHDIQQGLERGRLVDIEDQ